MRIAAAIILLACLAAATALAEPVSDLYFALSYTTGTEEPERTIGFRNALRNVVVKLTGDYRLEESALLGPHLSRPHKLVARFKYEDRMKGIPVHDEQGTRERPHFLRVWFEPDGIDRLLADLGLRKWAADRPPIDLWLGVLTDTGAFVLTVDGEQGYGQRAVVESTAARRGLPVRLPSAEIAAGTFDETALPDLARIREAAANTGALLVGTLRPAPKGFWDIDWILEWRGQARRWSAQGVTYDIAIRRGLERSALILSGQSEP